MKKIFFILLCSIFAIVMNAQWTSVINPSAYSTYGASIVMDNQGNIYSLGNVFVNTTEKENIIVVKYNNSGDTLWTRTYDNAGNSDKATKAAVDSENNLIIAGTTSTSANGDDVLCLKYSPNGELLNTFTFDGTAHLDDRAVDIVIDENNNYYIGGISTSTSQRNFILIKTNAELEKTWHKTHTLYYGADLRKIHYNQTNQQIAITGNYTDWEHYFLTALVVYNNEGTKIIDEYYRTLEERSSVGFDAIITNDLSVYVCGYEANEETNVNDALLMKYNQNGDVLWTKKVYSESIGAAFKSMIIDNAANVFITGKDGANAITAKYDTDGNQIWIESHTSKSSFSTNDTYESIKQSNDGSIFVTASNMPANGGGAMIIKYNESGQHQWTQYYNGSVTGLDEPVSFCLDENGNQFLLVNSRNSTNYINMVTVMFLNQSSQSSQISTKENNFCVYPNPANNYCYFNNIFSEDINLKIYSSEGKLIRQSVIKSDVEQFSLEGIPNGIYFIQFESGKQSYSTKLSVQK
ncbi:MAG: T9SS type A sorting domain-containing protein [Bacteroidales bacterium]|nr:T9SS type A sorting domain-containing protein [Bacteroidales bacterium]MDD4215831.1 T9SS type A sorting domain-containing protein [Bacteroidales bacterium]MDY0141975.1 T9SS type A sorting domain-containing protein [Bacteroidales bacterium]